MDGTTCDGIECFLPFCNQPRKDSFDAMRFLDATERRLEV